ncbi:ArsA family ATPase [Gordonia sinesedis]
MGPIPDIVGVFRNSDAAMPVSAHLHVLTLDRLELVEQAWARFADILGDTTRHSKLTLPAVDTLAGIDAAELTSLPGIEDFVLLRRIRDEAVSGRWRRIVVDLSGTGDPFAFLRSASVLSQALGRMWPRHRRLAAAAERPVLAQVSAAVDAIDADCADVAELLTDAHALAAHLVVGADDRAGRALPHYLAGCDLMGLPLRSVHLNEGVGGDLERAAAAVEGVLAAAPDGPERTDRVPAVDAPLDRPARLRRLDVTLPAPNGRAHGSGAARVTQLAGTDDAPDIDRSSADVVYELSWTQRLPDPSSLALGRSGDDLLVTVGGLRHPVRLPSVLRRCEVVDARWADATIVVRFRPDPAVWPQR